MPNSNKLNDELVGIEAALASLAPVESMVDRDRLMYRAGQDSATVAHPRLVWNGASRLWSIVSAASVLAAITFGMLYFRSTTNRVETRIVYVEVEKPKSADAAKKLWYDLPASKVAENEPAPSAFGNNGMNYLALTQIIAAHGVEGIPELTPPSPAGNSPRHRPMTIRDWENF
jgi:hypothetical protein